MTRGSLNAAGHGVFVACLTPFVTRSMCLSCGALQGIVSIIALVLYVGSFRCNFHVILKDRTLLLTIYSSLKVSAF